MNFNKGKLFFIMLVLCGGLTTQAFASLPSNYCKTKYPIVLVGGALINFDKLGPVDYFYKIPQTLQEGGAEVFVSTVSAASTTEFRGEQLAREVERILALTGKAKVNLISISAGGRTARYVAHVYPKMVASVTTIDGGHFGVPLADAVLIVDGYVRKVLPPSWVGPVSRIYDLVDAGISLIALLAGDNLDQDSRALAIDLSTEESALTNQKYPEGMPSTYCGQGVELAANGVRYYSMAGAKPMTNAFDSTDYALGIAGLLFNGEPNDGCMGACSSHWGRNIGDRYDMNHLDMANHLFGIRSIWLDPITLYTQQANRLKNRGL